MSAHIITYDLSQPGRNYADLYARIKSYPAYAMITESSWAVATDRSPEAVRDHLVPALDRNDTLFVSTLGDSEWAGLSDEISNWLKENL